jgi:diguanylate cyclase (GGDEF)-like protein/PAS domain S-box-containing protein
MIALALAAAALATLLVSVIARDVVTREHNAERSLRIADARFRAAVDLTSTGLAVFDETGTLVDRNHALIHILGNHIDTFLRERHDQIRRYFEQAEPPAPEGEVTLTGDGSVRRLKVAYSSILEKDQCILVVLAVDDVTAVTAAGAVSASRPPADEGEQRPALMDRAADPVTTLPDRTAFEGELQAAVAQASEHPFALLVIDLERFAEIRPAHGIEASDAVLTIAAGRLRTILSRRDWIARIGSERFAIILRNCGDADRRAIEAIAERIQDSLRRPIVIDDVELSISAAIGISFSRPGDDDPQTIAGNAESALGAARSQGQGRHAIYFPQNV